MSTKYNFPPSYPLLPLPPASPPNVTCAPPVEYLFISNRSGSGESVHQAIPASPLQTPPTSSSLPERYIRAPLEYDSFFSKRSWSGGSFRLATSSSLPQTPPNTSLLPERHIRAPPEHGFFILQSITDRGSFSQQAPPLPPPAPPISPTTCPLRTSPPNVLSVTAILHLLLQCWGKNVDGQCGGSDVGTLGDDEGEMGDDLPYVDLGTGRTAVAITTGEAHTCALLDDGSVKVTFYSPG